MSREEMLEDRRYAEYKSRYESLADFLTDYEFGKGLQHLTQSEIARRIGTTQSAVSRFEAMKNPPTYDFLRRISEALGDKLFLSPLGSTCLSVPYDLHDSVRLLAQSEGQPVRDYLQACLREAIESKVTAGVERVSAAGISYRAPAAHEAAAEWLRGRHEKGVRVSAASLSLKNDYEDLAA